MNLLDETLDMETRVWTLGALIKHDYWTGEFTRAMDRCSSLEKAEPAIEKPLFRVVFGFSPGPTIRFPWENSNGPGPFWILASRDWNLKRRTFWLPRMRNTLGWILALEKDPVKALSVNRKALSEALVGDDPETIYNARLNIAENLPPNGATSTGPKKRSNKSGEKSVTCVIFMRSGESRHVHGLPCLVFFSHGGRKREALRHFRRRP